jgi:ribonuclease Z
MKLTILGTGSPTPNLQRRGPSQTIEVGDDVILIDTGAGTLHRLVEAGFAELPITAIAFTHLHSDHITGLLDILWAGWIRRRWKTAPTIYGPPGTKHFVDHLIEAMSYDIRVRSEEAELLSRESLVPNVVEFEEDWQLEGKDWRLSAFRVDHLPVDQAFGFRVDQDSSSIVISGDTKVSENLVKHSQEADILVHEVYWKQGLEDAAAEAIARDPVERIRFELLRSYHTGSHLLGKVANDANARHLVLSHIIRPRPDADFSQDISPAYSGELTVGEDLMTFEV